MLPITAVNEILERFPSRVLISLPALGNEQLQIDAGHLRAQIQVGDNSSVFTIVVRDSGKLVTWGKAASAGDALIGALEAITLELNTRTQAA